MSEEKFVGDCQWCNGTGIESYIDNEGHPATRPCTHCGADGKIESTSGLDTTNLTSKLDALQSSIDQVSEIVKTSSEYIEKIYEIVSKGK